MQKAFDIIVKFGAALLLSKKLVWTPWMSKFLSKNPSVRARLFEPQTLVQNNLVYQLIEAKGRDKYEHWIGINDKAEEGT